MSDGERLERLRKYADDGLRYFATAYHRIASFTPDRVDEFATIRNDMVSLGHVMALVEGHGERSAIEQRYMIVERYLSEAASGEIVWSPEAGVTTEEELVRKVAIDYGVADEEVELIRRILPSGPPGVVGHRVADVIRIAHAFGVSPRAFAEFLAAQALP